MDLLPPIELKLSWQECLERFKAHSKGGRNRILSRLSPRLLAITLGADGMLSKDGKIQSVIPTAPERVLMSQEQVRVIATLTLSLAKESIFERSAELANLARGCVGKVGTATTSPKETWPI